MSAPIALSERITYWMDRAGLNGTELARAVGVSDATVSNWRNGRNNATLDNVAAIADACGISLGEFWGSISAAEIRRLRGEAA